MQRPLKLPVHKTKIICTIGPSSCSLSRLEGMMEGGMNIARLNCAHGDFKEHARNIRNIRTAAFKTRRMVSIFLDLPGVKIRIGDLPNGSVMLKKGEPVVLTTRKVTGTRELIPVEHKQFPHYAAAAKVIFLNDGFIQLKIERISGLDVHCKVLIGGRLLSHKGLNLPGARININPITASDLRIVDFGLKQGITLFGLSFVEKAGDIMKVREFAAKKGHSVYLIAKIERRGAVENIDEILKAADAVMIARGDLGVEVPLEELPGIQKRLIQKANILGRPVITATQMLESMTQNVRPTRAEVNDVANAILDGTDAVMLSEETAIGEFPIETVHMMSQIARTTEGQRQKGLLSDEGQRTADRIAQGISLTITDVISMNAFRAAHELNARYILTPTKSGSTARRISRFKPHCWVLSLGGQAPVCEFLNFSYGVHPILLNNKITGDPPVMIKCLQHWHLVKKGDTLVLTERRLFPHPGHSDSLGIVTL